MKLALVDLLGLIGGHLVFAECFIAEVKLALNGLQVVDLDVFVLFCLTFEASEAVNDSKRDIVFRQGHQCFVEHVRLPDVSFLLCLYHSLCQNFLKDSSGTWLELSQGVRRVLLQQDW